MKQRCCLCYLHVGSLGHWELADGFILTLRTMVFSPMFMTRRLWLICTVHVVIWKMLTTLDDLFTHFPKSDKFKSLQSRTQGIITSVGLQIVYPTGFEGSPAGLLVILATPGGPASRADILYKVNCDRQNNNGEEGFLS
ncbi:hypothetical protein PVL29_025983 [Vitis rotundifolia]|uniref:Uncharacterized protein n=1 Tax=Vitis rotundifolia TaxID=103349 RepID=A0AA38YLD3_VITRO|nr:hypothetical protein PVL29_025983 [Vitis rotundifolia]